MYWKSPSLLAIALLGLVSLILPSSARADLISAGTNASIQVDYPTLGSLYAGPVSGSTSSAISFSGYTFTFTGDTITYSNDTGGTYASVPSGGFNGFVLTFTGLADPINGVTNDPGSQLDPSSIAFTGNSVTFNLAGLTRSAGEQTIFDVTFGSSVATPEPSSLLLLGAGLLGLGLMSLSLRRKSAETAVMPPV
jgi:hypothetical protein